MSESTEIYIKQEIDDKSGIKIENVEPLEMNEHIVNIGKEQWNDSKEIEDKSKIKIENVEQQEINAHIVYDEELWNHSQEIEQNEFDDETIDDPLSRDDLALTNKELNHVKWLSTKAQDIETMKGKIKSQMKEYKRLADTLKTTKEPNIRENISIKMRKLESESLSLHPASDSEGGEQFYEVREPVDDPVYSTKHKNLTKKKKKTLLERERRKGLQALNDELDSLVMKYIECGDERLNRTANGFYKSAYHERINAATKCIKDLEASIRGKEVFLKDLHTRNEQLSAKLDALKFKSFATIQHKEENSRIVENVQLVISQPNLNELYSCEECLKKFRTVQEAFAHDTSIHGTEVESPTDKSIESTPDQWSVFKCKDCPTLCLDSLSLQVHKLLHLDLTYFKCQECDFLFGLPSKLKRHYFLSHEKILDSPDLSLLILDMVTRIDITLSIQDHLISSDPRNVEAVDNFLEASLDAKLIQDELLQEEEVDKLSKNQGVVEHFLKCVKYKEI